MKESIKTAYAYYHNPLSKECEREFKGLPILFGRTKKEKAIREKYEKKGLTVIRYEDFFTYSNTLKSETYGDYKACVINEGHGRFVCGIDGALINNCEECMRSNNCQKLQNFLWSDLYD